MSIVVLLAILLAACSTHPVTPTPPVITGEPIKVGAAFALTGEESELDRPAADGARLAVKEINASGGVLGRRIDLVMRDTQYKMDVTALVARQLVDQDKVVAVIGFTDTDSLLAAGPIVQRAGLPFITPGATSPKIPQQIGDKVFLACFGDNVQAAAGAEFAAKRFGTSAYLLRNDGVEYTKLLAAYFKARFASLGGVLVLEDRYDDKASDFASQIAKVKALPRQPDFYYVAAMPYDVGPLVKQFRAAGLMGPIVGGDGYDTPDLIGIAGRAADNVFFTTHALMDANAGPDRVKTFIAAYKKEFGRDPENAFAALGYDAVNLLAAGMRRAGSTNGTAVQKALEGIRNLRGVTGSISFFPGSHVPRKGVTLIAIKDGTLTLGAEIVPEKVPVP